MNTKPTTIYTKPACVQCIATKREFDKHGLPYILVDLTQDERALELVQGLGYQQVPIVIAAEQHWAGFRPDRIKTLANRPHPTLAAL
ncbi:NrdH-redoxin [Mycobacterium sp. MFM001]|uniref:glutaredoxin-like protein NrdH n=1 Tax=Mycobacterium sp. MFM001 TaxID=2049453 RepID=UPI000DA49392|nr:glutaredoxin-like protein NrdH [Mycobacterium sp. MFM001]GBE67765.1 NrdH-redoxin [Mycobacterium sp. MFM001]